MDIKLFQIVWFYMGLNLCSSKDYSEWKLHILNMESNKQLQQVFEYERIKNSSCVFWSHKRCLHAPILIQVSPQDDVFKFVLKKMRVEHSVTVVDVEPLLMNEQKTFTNRNPLTSIITIPFGYYLSFDEIALYLKTLSTNYPETTKLIPIGSSFEGRRMHVLRISNDKSRGKNSFEIFIEAGMHGREWLGISTAVYIINQLVEHSIPNKDMLNDIVWYILPITNPDGYEYTIKEDRLWKNNRNNHPECEGVDLNTNFETKKIFVNYSSNQFYCSMIVGNEKPFSESETDSIRKFLTDKNQIELFLSLHSGDSFIAYPYGYTYLKAPEQKFWAKISEKIKNQINKLDKRAHMIVGQMANLTGEQNGVEIDWMYDVKKIKTPLMISFKGGHEKGFDISREDILESVAANFEGIRAAVLMIKDHKNSKSNLGDVGFRSLSSRLTANHYFLIVFIIFK